jgi:hypothetical protein
VVIDSVSSRGTSVLVQKPGEWQALHNNGNSVITFENMTCTEKYNLTWSIGVFRKVVYDLECTPTP